MPRTWDVAQLTVVFLLAWAAYWAALPWIDCVRQFPRAEIVQACTVGLAVPGGPPALGWNVLVGSAYVAASIWVALRRR